MSDAVDHLMDAYEALTGFWADAGLEIPPPPSRRAADAEQPAFVAFTPPPPPSTRRRSDPIADARQLAARAQDWPSLGAAIAAFDGCPLKKAARRTVFSDGVAGAPVLVIGEAPGKEEDEIGKPFVGRAGQLLDKMLATIGLSRHENVLITNTIFWRPPGNRTPTQGEIAACLPFVERAIALAQPKLLILTGGVAAQSVLKRTEGVMKLRGRRLKHSQPELTEPLNAIVMLHPAYLLSRPQDKALAWADLLALETWLAELGIAAKPLA